MNSSYFKREQNQQCPLDASKIFVGVFSRKENTLTMLNYTKIIRTHLQKFDIMDLGYFFQKQNFWGMRKGRGVERQRENTGFSSMRKCLDTLHSYREQICCYQSSQLVLEVTQHIWNPLTYCNNNFKITKKRPPQPLQTSLCKHLMHKMVKIPSTQSFIKSDMKALQLLQQICQETK